MSATPAGEWRRGRVDRSAQAQPAASQGRRGAELGGGRVGGVEPGGARRGRAEQGGGGWVG